MARDGNLGGLACWDAEVTAGWSNECHWYHRRDILVEAREGKELYHLTTCITIHDTISLHVRVAALSYKSNKVEYRFYLMVTKDKGYYIMQG